MSEHCKHKNAQVLSGEPCPKCGRYAKDRKAERREQRARASFVALWETM